MERLSVYRCNPWSEIEKFQSLIQKPKSVTSQEVERKIGFDPGKITISHHISTTSDFENYSPGISFLRLFGQAALPMTCGNVRMFADDVIHASKQILPYYPLWGIFLMIRTGNTKEVGEWFDRIRIASLPSDQINYLSTIFIQSFRQSLHHLFTEPPPDTFNKPNFSYHNVDTLSEVLSRLCFRFSNEQISELFKLTVQMYKSPFFYKSRGLFSCVNILFQRMLYSMSESMLLEKMHILLSLPIPTENGFEPFSINHWDEPSSYLEMGKNITLSSDFD